jgi:Carboxypeptidase regulatory-like domain
MTVRAAWPFVAPALVVAVGAVATAQQRPSRDTSSPQSTTPAVVATARISGRVVAVEGGRPVSRARVMITAGNDLPGGRAMLTDESGVFDFTDLPAGRYTVTASKTGYVSISYGQRRPLQAGTPLQLTQGQQVRNLDLRLPRGSAITGHVFDESGEPLPGTTVRVLMYRYAQGNRQLVPAGNAQTDDRGEYRVWGLNPGDYYVSAVVRNFNVNPLGRGGPGGPPLPLPAPGGPQGPGAPAGLDPAALDAALTARGLPGLAALSGDVIGADDQNQMSYAPTYYPGAGSPAEARPVTVGLSAEVLGIDFNVMLVRTGRVSGHAANADGSPVSNGNINLTPDAGTLARGAVLGGGYGSRIQDGTFSIANVPPGRYILRATGSGGRGRGGRGRGLAFGSGSPASDLPQFAVQPLSVNGDIDNVMVTLSPGATLSGNITVQATQSALLPDVTRFRINAPSADPSVAAPQMQARVEQDGSFTLEGIQAGLVWIRAQTPTGWTLKSVIVDSRDVIDTPLEVRSAQGITGVNLVFTDKLTEISGTVSDQIGTPMPEFTVLAFPTDAALWRPQARQIMTTRPDQNGKYQLRGLPPGDYYVAAIDPEVPGEWFEPTFLDEQRRGASQFSLVEGDVKTQDLRVIQR